MFKPQNLRPGDSTEIKNMDSYTGNWFWESADTTRSFKILLIRQADSVFGQYCAAYDKGKQLDCEFNTHYNMFGHKLGDSVILQFKTFYGAKNGIAVLKADGTRLKWTITTMPVGGNCYAPPEAVMYRSIKNW